MISGVFLNYGISESLGTYLLTYLITRDSDQVPILKPSHKRGV